MQKTWGIFGKCGRFSSRSPVGNYTIMMPPWCHLNSISFRMVLDNPSLSKARTHTHWEITKFPMRQLSGSRNHKAIGQVSPGTLTVAQLEIMRFLNGYGFLLLSHNAMGMRLMDVGKLCNSQQPFLFSTGFDTSHGIKLNTTHVVVLPISYFIWHLRNITQVSMRLILRYNIQSLCVTYLDQISVEMWSKLAGSRPTIVWH